MSKAAVTDPYLEPISAGRDQLLQTSPEYAMKRLLANGSGDIYQICKAFRQEEKSRKHREEFSLLEWYRLDFDQWDLMTEVADLLEHLMAWQHFEYVSYGDIFERYLGIDPHTVSDEALIIEARQHVNIAMSYAGRDDWLSLLMSHLIEPELGQDAPTFIYDYPPSQAALARLGFDERGRQVGERFELYYKGLELCNGYHELIDSSEQRQRCHDENVQRLAMKKSVLPVDYEFLSAIERGLPPCAGVALGLDRLLMLILKEDSIDSVQALSICEVNSYE